MSLNETVEEKKATVSTGNNTQEEEKDNPYEEVMTGIIEPAVLPMIPSSGALKGLMDLVMAIPADRVRKLGVSVPQAVAAGRHYARCYAEDRAAFVQALNPCVFDPASHDNMAKRAEALWEADILLEKTEENNDDVTRISDQARRVKRRLLRTAEYLWGDDRDRMEMVSIAKNGNSYMDLADNIFTLYHLFIENWDEVNSRSDVTEEELNSAHALGNQLLDAIGPSRDEMVKAVQDLRDRAGEYLRQGIDDIGTAAGFIFRNDPKHLSRYPNLGSLRRRRKTDTEKRSNGTVIQPPAQDDGIPVASNVLAQAG